MHEQQALCRWLPFAFRIQKPILTLAGALHMRIWDLRKHPLLPLGLLAFVIGFVRVVLHIFSLPCGHETKAHLQENRIPIDVEHLQKRENYTVGTIVTCVFLAPAKSRGRCKRRIWT
jgi:hypothetical protein